MAALIQVGLAFVLVITTITAEDQCRTGCHGVTPNTFKYAVDNTYEYQYEGNIDVSLSSVEGQASTTKVKATVLLSQQGDCNQVLQVQNLQITGGDSKKYTNIPDIEKPIILNFHDGHIEDVICTDPSDSQNSLNIKRALASHFQAALKYHGTEIDVFGSCPTEFSTRKEGGFDIIKKTRNLNKCAHREALRQDFMTTTFDPNSEIKTSPFLQGRYESELKVKNGIPQLITVKENYLYVPFSNKNKGANAVVSGVLKYTGVSKKNVRTHCTVPKSILFDDPSPLTTDKHSVNTILTAVKETANAIDLNVKSDSAGRFASIIKLLRGAPKQDIASVWSQVRSGAGFKDKTVGERVFLDALFRARTGNAIEVAIDIYKGHDLSEVESKLFFVSLNLVRYATEGSLTAAANLLSLPNLPREAYLGVGVLARRYCQHHSCVNVPALNSLLNALQSKLVNKPANREAENVAIVALKAISNAGQVTNSLVGRIIEIAQDKLAPSRLRVAALETYLANACNDRFRDSAVSILKDTQLDSEIRIKAYLAAAECPNGKIASAVKALIDDEPSVQVGGFIVSHLATLRASVNPDKALAKAQLGQIRTVKKYPLDFRQYSFNGEYSYDFDSLGVGESLEGNVIYSQKSFVPRSISLNLTSEIFGHRYNFLEIDTRQENLDSLVGSYFGPNGYLRKKSSEELVNQGSSNVQELLKNAGSRYHALKHSKTKREINKNQLNSFIKQLQVKESALNKDFDLDLSVKLFGSEHLFLSLNEDIQKYTPDAVVESFFDKLDEISKYPDEFDKTITSNLIFLDSEVAYPTSTGFPLRLSVEGTTSVHVKAAGSQLCKFIFGEGDRNYKLTLIPSVNAQISARFIVDAALVESGLKVVGNLYSSVGSSVELSVKANSFDYKLKLPLEKEEILTLTHDVVFETRELCGPVVETPVKFVESKDFSVCSEHLKPYIGLTVCAVLKQPNIGEVSTNILPFPLNGNSKISVVIHKNDFGHLRYYDLMSDNGLEGFIEVVDVNDKAKSSFKYDVKIVPPTISLELIAQDANAKFETSFVQTQSEYYGLLRFAFNQLEYYLKLGVQYSGSSTQVIYTPIMEYKAGQGEAQKTPYHVTGQIVVQQLSQEGGTKYIFKDLQLIGPDISPIGVTGNVVKQPGELSSDIGLTDGIHKGSLKGKLQFLSQGFNANAQFVNTVNPTSNFDIKYSLTFVSPVDLESSLQLIHGPDISNKNALLKVYNLIKYKEKGDDSELATEHEIYYPGLGLDNKFKLETSKGKLELELKLGYNKIKVGTELDIQLDKKTKGDFDVEFELYGFDNKLEVDLKRVVSGYKSKIHHKLTLNGNSLEVKGDVKHLLEQQRADISQDLVIKITSRPDINLKSVFKFTQNDIDTSIKISSGHDVIVDAFLKADSQGNANGNLKLTIPGYMITNGNIKSTKGAGSVTLLVNLLQLQRKLKSDGTFTIAEPTYNLDLTLYSNFEKDNTRKYRLVTNNQIKPESLLDSKNTLDVLGHKTSCNLKLSRSGDINNFDQAAEVELILPTEEYYAAKANRKVINNKGVLNAQAVLSLEQRPNKNSAGKTLTLKGVGKDMNLSEGIYDLTYTLTLDNGGGKALTGDLYLKESKVNKLRRIDYSGKLYGSALPEPLEGSIVAQSTETGSHYKISSNYGKSATLNIKGKYNVQDNDRKEPFTGELFVDVLTPNSAIRVAKFDIQGSVTVPESESGSWVYKGSTSLFVDDDGSQEGATLNLKYETDSNLGVFKGHGKDIITIQKNKIVLNVEYDHEPDKKLHTLIGVQYNDKPFKAIIDLAAPNNQTFNYDFQFETPLEKPKTVRLQGQVLESQTLFKYEGSLTVDGEKYVGKASFDLEEEHPFYDLELLYPTGKTDRLYAKQLRYDNSGFAGESKIIFHIYDFVWENNYDVVVNSAEDFALKFYLDCPKLKADKIQVSSNTKEIRGAKKLLVIVKQAGKKILDGSTSYKVRKEGGKIIVDGSGTLLLNNEKKSGTFKVLYKELKQERDKETGVELAINGIIGSKAFDIEYILTTEHFKYLTSYCVEKKECAHFEIEQKEQANNLELLQINVDLRPLGVSHEFGLKSETQAKELKHSMDVHLVSNQNKYQYNQQVLPTNSHFTLTTPNRIISLESEVNSPTRNEPYVFRSVLYLNKKAKPNEKSVLEVNLVREKGKEGSFKSTFTAPKLQKPLTVSFDQFHGPSEGFELIVDVIPNSHKKIVISETATFSLVNRKLTVTEKSVLDLQPIDYKLFRELSSVQDNDAFVYTYDYVIKSTYRNNPIVSSFNSKYSRDVGYSKLVIYNKLVYEVSSVAKLGKEHSIIDTDYKVIGLEPAKSRLEIKNGNTLNFELYKADAANKKLKINSGFIPGSIADFRMYVQSGADKHNLVHGSVNLDDANFGQSDYGIDTNNIDNYLVKPSQEHGQKVVKESTESFSKALDETKVYLNTVGDAAKTSTPDYRPLLAYYEGELKGCRDELITDESLKKLSETLDSIIATVATVTLDFIKVVRNSLEEVIAAIHKQSINFADMCEKDILPKAQEVLKILVEKIASASKSVTDLVFSVLGYVASFFEAHKEELKQLSTALSQLSQDIARFLQRAEEQIEQVVVTECNRIIEELKALNIQNVMKNYLSGIPMSPSLTEEQIQEFKEHVQELKSKITYPKVLVFVDLTANYIEKKLRDKSCDDLKEISDILAAGLEALDEVFEDLTKIDLERNLLKLPIPSKILDTIPEFVLGKNSLLNRYLNGDLPSLDQIQLTLNPKQFGIPTRKYAVVAQGQHIFTFDGKHLTFPGKCSYLLARDNVDNEFSIVANYVNGAFSELSFLDQNDTITLKKSGAASLNNVASEFPIRGRVTHAFRTYEQVQIKSEAGVNIYCEPDLSLCLFSVSGFYHGRLRGLLGNANAEPYDDYTTAKGQIVNSESDFGNSYKIQSSCASVQTVDHHSHHHAESCTKLFTELSELALCYPFVDKTNFRQACDHGVHANIPDTEAAIAKAYVSACYSRGVPTFLPKQYIKCTNSEESYELYDTFSVKLPQKAADIVFAIDASKETAEIYKDLVSVLGSSLVKDLNDRGIKDIEYHVITYGGEFPDWPAHITTNGGKMTFKGRLPNLKFGDAPPEDDVDVQHEGLNFFLSLVSTYLNELKLAIGLEPQSEAYLEATQYPFRTNAVKAIVAVSSKPCQKSEFSLLQKLRATIVKQPGIHLNLITPLGKDCSFSVKDEKTTLNTIGFNSKAVFTYADAKKKLPGNPALLKELSYDDFCSEYTIASGGNVFVLDNFTKNKKPFISVTSFNIAEQLVSTEEGLDCICVRDGLFTAKNRCITAYSKEKPSTRKLLKG